MKTELGKTGITVSRIGLGAMPLSLIAKPDVNTAIRVIHQAIESGIQLIDTADVYCQDESEIGHNERLIGKSIRLLEAPPDVIVATKGGCTRSGDRWGVDASPKQLRKSCEQSLRNFGQDQIVLYQLHAPDSNTPFERSIETLAQLQTEGKIQHIGLSNITSELLNEALDIVRIETIQNLFNPFSVNSREIEMVKICEQKGITFISHSPMGGYLNHHKRVIAPTIVNLAQKYQCSPYVIVLCWHLATSKSILPIPGASKISTIIDNVKANHIRLSKNDLSLIDSLQCQQKQSA